MSYVRDALSENEQIMLCSAKHPVVLLRPLVYNVALLVVVVYAATYVQVELRAAMFSLLIFPLCFFAFSYLNWWNEEYFLTTHRVIRCVGILDKRVSDSSLEKVNDVLLFQSWIGRLLDFGDVEILTASEIGANKFQTMRSPVSFKTAMLSQKEALGAADSHGAGVKERSRGRVADLISGLEKLRQEGAITETEFSEKKRELLAQM